MRLRPMAQAPCCQPDLSHSPPYGMRLITLPVGLNIYVINGIAPEIPLREVLRRSVSCVLCTIAGIILLCILPDIAIWLPIYPMGSAI